MKASLVELRLDCIHNAVGPVVAWVVGIKNKDLQAIVCLGVSHASIQQTGNYKGCGNTPRPRSAYTNTASETSAYGLYPSQARLPKPQDLQPSNKRIITVIVTAHCFHLNPSTNLRHSPESPFGASTPCISILPLESKKFKPFLGFAFSKSPAFFSRLFRPFFLAQPLLDIIPENVSLYGRSFSCAGRAAQPPVAAYYGQSLRRCAYPDFILDYGVGIGSPARKKDFQIIYIVKFAFVRGTRTVKNNFAFLAGQP
jgi:hypothetical protein